MKYIHPYKTRGNALAALDNGGRFYNLITQANDGEISTAELGRVAGLFNNRQKMVLYLEMSICDLELESISDIRSSLSEELKQVYKKYQPQVLLPSTAQNEGIISSNAIVTGIPRYVKSNSDFTGFIFIPISTGKVTTMVMVPLIDHYDVYELRDEGRAREFLIAHARSSKKLPEESYRFGGVFKTLQKDEKDVSPSVTYLETQYFTSVQ